MLRFGSLCRGSVLSSYEQVVGQSVAVLTRDWQKNQNDRTGAVFGRCASQLFPQWVVQHSILSESKTILAESDLILFAILRSVRSMREELIARELR